MKTQNRFLAIGILALAMLPGLAAADDDKTLPGAACQPSRSHDAVLRGGESPGPPIQANDLGGMFNTEEQINGRQTWICPIIRDSVTGTAGIRDAQINVIDQNSREDVECRVCSRSAGGVGGGCTEVQRTTGASDAAVQLNFPTLAATPGGGYYFALCDIPPRQFSAGSLGLNVFPTLSGGVSGIVSYRWNELGGP